MKSFQEINVNLSGTTEVIKLNHNCPYQQELHLLIIEGNKLWSRKKYQIIALRERVTPRKRKTFERNHTGG